MIFIQGVAKAGLQTVPACRWPRISVFLRKRRSEKNHIRAVVLGTMMEIKVLICIFFVKLVSAQSEGDVRLTGGTSAYFGRLDIFLKGTWGTFCSISKGGAQAACRQLGYLDAIRYLPLDQTDSSWKIPKADDNVPISIKDTSCDYSWTNGLLHILRCGYSSEVVLSCSHSNDIVLVCENLPLWQHPYNTQVRLKFKSFPSKGTLEVYLNQQWGNICYSTFNQNAANSACRQMGYTNAKAIEGTATPSSNITWLDKTICKKSCACLNGCFKAPSSAVSCKDKQYVSIECTFDSALAKEATSGSKDYCSSNSGMCNNGSSKASSGDLVVLIVVSVIAVLLFAVIVVVLVVCLLVPTCYLARRCRAKGYQSISEHTQQ